ncbi:hypothetical protein DXG01_011286 [Tephrocybe rancida]|nr:hypothetical protein DXG01_011286 [Tephrocybe rancida]
MDQKASVNTTGELRVISPLIQELKSIFNDNKLCKRLVECSESQAQLLLNSFQQLLDRTDLELSFRKKLMVNMQRLSSKSGLYPMCYKLKSITGIGEDPVEGGGAADIYKGKFRRQLVCLKMVRVYGTSQIDDLLKVGLTDQKFSKEAMLWGQLSHPNVLAIYGLYCHRKRPCVVAPWMENGHIGEYLKKCPDAPRARLALDVGSGLMYLHNNDIVHGDLKSSNVLVDDAGRARLADFGISSVLDVNLQWTTQHTYGSEGGSLRWRAPEVLEARGGALVKNSKESDIYAWGCVAWEIFTGQYPFPEIELYVVRHHILTGASQTRPDPSHRAWSDFGLTEEIWECMKQCWEWKPSARPFARTIVQRLNATFTTVDPRPSSEADTLSPSEFRRKMNEGFNMITTEVLNRIISPGHQAARAEGRTGVRVGGANWKKEIRSDDTFFNDGRSGDLIILILGISGSGKSTFVNNLLGYEAAPLSYAAPHSETERLHAYGPILAADERRVFIVDTPGFNHSGIDDREVFRRIAVWLAKSYSNGIKVSGIIYLQDITQSNWTSSWDDIPMVKAMCGPAAATNVIIALTAEWSNVQSHIGERKAELLQSRWKDMLDAGSTACRLENSQRSAEMIVEAILARRPLDGIRIQRELVDDGKSLSETDASHAGPQHFSQRAQEENGTGGSRSWMATMFGNIPLVRKLFD